MTTLTGYRADRDGAYIDKDSEAVLDYGLNWADWMPTADTISTSNWTVSTISGDSDPLAVDSSAVSGTTCTAVISGGTAGKGQGALHGDVHWPGGPILERGHQRNGRRPERGRSDGDASAGYRVPDGRRL